MISNKTPNRLIAPDVDNQHKIALIEPEKIVLKNGTQLFLFPDNSREAMRMDMVFDAGSAFQDKKLAASTTIGMLREGSKKFTAGALNMRIDYHGAYLDLQNTKDHGYLTLYCLEKSLPALLPLIQDMLTQAVFKERNFKIYNKRQMQEFQLSSQKAKHLANRLYTANLYGAESVYGQIACESDFDALTTTDLKAFYGKHFQPANTKIILSGPVSQKTIHQIESWFGDIENTLLPTDFVQNTLFQPKLLFKKKSGALQSAIMMGKPVMLRTHKDYFGFLVLNTILGGYFGSRLMANIREDKGYTYGIHSMVSPMRKASGFTIASEVGTDVTKAALDEIKLELLRLIENPVKDEELRLVKNYLNGTYLRSLDGAYSQADKFRITLDLDGRMDYYTRSLDAINAIGATELRDLAERYLNPDEMLTVVVGDKEVE